LIDVASAQVGVEVGLRLTTQFLECCLPDSSC
jgi:hypothetical protein